MLGPPPLPPASHFGAKKLQRGRGGEGTVRLKLVKEDDVRCV